MNTSVNIVVTNMGSQVLTHSQTLPSFSQSSWFHTWVCSVVFLFCATSQLQMRVSRVMKQKTVQFSRARPEVG